MNFRRIVLLRIFIALFVLNISNFGICLQDTQKTRKISNKEKSKLDLPDVVIYGSEKSTRLSGKKISAEKESIKLIDRKIEYTSITSEKISIDDKLQYFEKSQLSQVLTTLSLQYSSFNTPALQLSRWEEKKNFNYGIDVGYLKSNGEFTNSQYSDANAQFNCGILFTSAFNIKLRTNFSRINYGIYGAAISDFKREIDNMSVELISQININSKNVVAITGLVRQIEPTDDVLIDNYNNSFNEKTQNLSVRYTSNFASNIQFNIKADYEKNFYSRIDSSWNYATVTTDLVIPLKQFLTIKSLLTYEYITNFSSRFSPGFELVFTPTSRIGFSVHGSRYYNPIYYYELWRENRFYSLNMQAPPSDVKFDFRANLEFRPINELTLKLNFTQKWIKNYSFWQKDSLNLYGLTQLEEVSIRTFSAGLNYQASDMIKICADLIFFNDDIKNSQFPSVNNMIPYLEEYRIPIKLELNLPKKIMFHLNTTLIGPRNINLNSNDKLENFIYVSLYGEKLFSTYFTFFTLIENLTNRKYEVWQNYQEFSSRFFIGIKSKW